jgi:hypothetical protein
MGGAPTLRDDKSRQTDSPDGQNPFIFSDGRFGHRAFSLPDRVRVNSNLSMRFNLIWVVGCPCTKISLSEIQKSCIFPPSCPGKRGVRVVTNAGRDAVDADATRDERRNRGRRSRVVLAPRRWRYVLAGSNSCESNGGKRARSPGRARYKPLKPLRREGRMIRHHLWRLPCAYYQCTRAAGARWHPVFPAPSVFRGTTFKHSPGALRREIAGACPVRDESAF